MHKRNSIWNGIQGVFSSEFDEVGEFAVCRPKSIISEPGLQRHWFLRCRRKNLKHTYDIYIIKSNTKPKQNIQEPKKVILTKMHNRKL